ncbi:MAG: intradiol ring-cleavage dioxygenase [Bryobacteraceae bacterium]
MNPADKQNPSDMVSTSCSVHTPTRRLFLFRGMAGAAAVLCATRSGVAKAKSNIASCVLSREQTVGPYYLDAMRVRRDLTEGKPGLPLKLRLTVVDASRCLPVQNAAVDVWHCDALGIYSGITADSPGGPPGREHDNTTFLRGVQLTDGAGIVEFSTIFPGWYESRDVHIHVRIHVGGSITDARYGGGHIAYTGQLFFDEDITDAVALHEPYADHDVTRTRQHEDEVFVTQHGSGSMLALTQMNERSIEDGFIATAVLGIDPNAVTSSLILKTSLIT